MLFFLLQDADAEEDGFMFFSNVCIHFGITGG